MGGNPSVLLTTSSPQPCMALEIYSVLIRALHSFWAPPTPVVSLLTLSPPPDLEGSRLIAPGTARTNEADTDSKPSKKDDILNRYRSRIGS